MFKNQHRLCVKKKKFVTEFKRWLWIFLRNDRHDLNCGRCEGLGQVLLTQIKALQPHFNPALILHCTVEPNTTPQLPTDVLLHLHHIRRPLRELQCNFFKIICSAASVGLLISIEGNCRNRQSSGTKNGITDAYTVGWVKNQNVWFGLSSSQGSCRMVESPLVWNVYHFWMGFKPIFEYCHFMTIFGPFPISTDPNTKMACRLSFMGL